MFRTKRRYIPVEMLKRKELVKIVEEEGITIKEAATKLKINYSTAKHIIKTFRKTGKYNSTYLIQKNGQNQKNHQDKKNFRISTINKHDISKTQIVDQNGLKTQQSKVEALSQSMQCLDLTQTQFQLGQMIVPFPQLTHNSNFFKNNQFTKVQENLYQQAEKGNYENKLPLKPTLFKLSPILSQQQSSSNITTSGINYEEMIVNLQFRKQILYYQNIVNQLQFTQAQCQIDNQIKILTDLGSQNQEQLKEEKSISQTSLIQKVSYQEPEHIKDDEEKQNSLQSETSPSVTLI